MRILKQESGFRLNEGGGMARGLYNVSFEPLLYTTASSGVSKWFGEETKTELMRCGTDAFQARCFELISELNMNVTLS